MFESDSLPRSREQLEEGAVLLRGFATSEAPALLEEVARITQAAPFRHLVTPGGYTMSVAMTNCDSFGAATMPPLWHNCHLPIPGRARRTARSRDRRWAFRQRVHL